MFITHIGITEHKKTLRLLCSGTKLFMTFELKGFLTWGRERHNLSMTTFPSAPNHVRHPPQGLGELRKSTFFFGGKKLNSLTFLKSPKSSAHSAGAWRHSPPWSQFLSGIFILTSVNDTSYPHAREHLRSCCT